MYTSIKARNMFLLNRLLAFLKKNYTFELRTLGVSKNFRD